MRAPQDDFCTRVPVRRKTGRRWLFLQMKRSSHIPCLPFMLYLQREEYLLWYDTDYSEALLREGRMCQHGAICHEEFPVHNYIAGFIFIS